MTLSHSKDPITPVSLDRHSIVEAIHCASLPFRERFERAEQLVLAAKNRFPELAAVLDRKGSAYEPGADVASLQALGMIPPRSKPPLDLLRTEHTPLPESHCKDDYFYCLRGDYPHLEKTGIVSSVMRRWTLSLSDMLELHRGDEVLSHWDFRASNKLEEFMWKHSNGGFEAFVSVSTRGEIASQHPKFDCDGGTVYVVKVPEDAVFRNYASVVTGNEDEYLIPDLVLAGEIVAGVEAREVRWGFDARDYM